MDQKIKNTRTPIKTNKNMSKNISLSSSKTSVKTREEIVKDNKIKRTHLSLSKRKSRKAFFKKFRKVIFLVAGVFFVVAAVAIIRTLAYIQDLDSQLPSRDSVFAERPVASEIYDRTGTISLRRLFNEYNSDPVDIAEVPETVKWSFLASEDSEFYTHQGFDPVAILRCGVASLRSGGISCGGSTITQQLVKIAAPDIGNAISIERKIKELLMAIRVEQQSDKDEILEMYLRVAPFGSNIYGIRTAANFYFGKEPKDLTLAQATVLAGIIQNPIKLSPTLSSSKEEIFCRVNDGNIILESDVRNVDSGFQDASGNQVVKAFNYKCRQLYILGQISAKQDSINQQIRTNYDDLEKDDVFTTEIIEAARIEELKFQPPTFVTKAGHFVDYALEALNNNKIYRNGEDVFTLDELQKGGYKIITSLDYQIQQIAESYTQIAVDEGRYANMNNAAVMTTRPSTGEIIAMSGSRSYASPSDGCDANGANCKFNGQVNIFRTLQSPGSTNKPLGYYMAYKNGQLFTKSILPDIPFTLSVPSGFVYEPKNWNGGFLGMGTAEDMLRASRNLPAITIVQMIGTDNYINTSKEWGYTTYRGDEGPSVILGGADVYGDEHVQAYSIFANNGDLVKLNPILRIEDKDGNIIYQAVPDRKTVGDPQAVYLLNQSLKNLEGISWDQRDLAAKTGTSEDSRDAWLMTWSPDFVNLAWGGNNNNEPMNQEYGYPPYIITPWVKRYLRDIGNAEYFAAKTEFTRPGSIYEGGGDCNEAGECLGLARGWLINDRNPQRDIIKTKVKVCSDQKDKVARPIDIALGKAEEVEFNYFKMPLADLQSQLDKYLRENAKPEDGRYPNGGYTDPCDIDRSGGVSGPFFNLTSVTIPTSGTINIKGGAFSTNGSVTSIQFLLDNQVIPSCTTSTMASFDITCSISTIVFDNGVYEFKARATDSSNVTNTGAVILLTTGNGVTPNIQFTSMPPANLTYGVNIGGLFTQNIEVQYNVAGRSLNNVQIYQIKTVGSTTTNELLGTMTSQPGGKFRYVWGAGVANENASYKFYIKSGVTGSLVKLESGQSTSIVVNKTP